jgi:hypothetical protein
MWGTRQNGSYLTHIDDLLTNENENAGKLQSLPRCLSHPSISAVVLDMEGRERRTRQMDEIKSTAAVNLQGSDASSASDSDLRDFHGQKSWRIFAN